MNKGLWWVLKSESCFNDEGKDFWEHFLLCLYLKFKPNERGLLWDWNYSIHDYSTTRVWFGINFDRMVLLKLFINWIKNSMKQSLDEVCSLSRATCEPTLIWGRSLKQINRNVHIICEKNKVHRNVSVFHFLDRTFVKDLDRAFFIWKVCDQWPLMFKKNIFCCTLQCAKHDIIFFYNSFNIIYAKNINLIARKAQKNE